MIRHEILPKRDLIQEVRRQRPLVHCITNYVTAGDVANMILAVGASPVMADGLREVEDITRLSRALVLNIGTLREPVVESMLVAGKLAAQLGHPVIFDPVGAGASAFRTETALRILKEVPLTVIRGNASEIRTLAGYLAEHGQHVGERKPPHIQIHSCGVDADEREKVTEANRESAFATLRFLSRETKAVIVMTGETDLIAKNEQVCAVKNGHSMMARITGTGCMLDGILAALMAVSSSEERFGAAVYAAAAHGICGEAAYARVAAEHGGTGSFRVYFMDAFSKLDDGQVQKEVRYEV